MNETYFVYNETLLTGNFMKFCSLYQESFMSENDWCSAKLIFFSFSVFSGKLMALGSLIERASQMQPELINKCCKNFYELMVIISNNSNLSKKFSVFRFCCFSDYCSKPNEFWKRNCMLGVVFFPKISKYSIAF